MLPCPIYMQNLLKNLLLSNNYTAINLEISNMKHFIVQGAINNQNTQFIIDTGANQSCLDKTFVQTLKLPITPETDTIGAIGIGNAILKMEKVFIKKLTLNNYIIDLYNFAVVDLFNVNHISIEAGFENIGGLIGSDILQSRKAIIDCYNNILYLQ